MVCTCSVVQTMDALPAIYQTKVAIWFSLCDIGKLKPTHRLGQAVQNGTGARGGGRARASNLARPGRGPRRSRGLVARPARTAQGADAAARPARGGSARAAEGS